MPNPSLIPPAAPGSFYPMIDLSRNMGRVGARGMAGNVLEKTLSPEEQATASDVETKTAPAAEAVAPVNAEVKTPEQLAEENKLKLERLQLLLAGKTPQAMSEPFTKPTEK